MSAETPRLSVSAQVNKLNTNDSNSESTSDTAPSELIATVDDLLNQLSANFNNVSAELISKMDQMSSRLDKLEATIKAGNEQATKDGEA